MSDGDIHNVNTTLQRNIERIKTSEDFSQHNRELLLKFKDYMFSEDLSKPRISRYLYTWHRMSPHVDFKLDNPDKDDLIRLVGKINQGEIKEMAEQTKREYKKAVKKFYTHFLDNKRDDINGKQLCDFFTLTVSTEQYVDPDRLPKPGHVKQLITAAKRPRDKALVATLWSTGGRIGEILGLRWKDIKLGDDIAKVTFRGTKTGGNRTVPMHAGFLYLTRHREHDHKGSDPEAFVFRSTHSDDQFSHNGACNVITRAHEHADLPERLKTNPHAFRKGRATYLARQGMNQAQLCQFFGWVQGSPEAAKYIRMAESDVENGIRTIAGLDTTETDDEDDIHPVKCHECNAFNTFEATNCYACGTLLESSELYTEIQVQEAKETLKSRMIEQGVGVDDDRLKDLAKEIVREEVNA